MFCLKCICCAVIINIGETVPRSVCLKGYFHKFSVMKVVDSKSGGAYGITDSRPCLLYP